MCKINSSRLLILFILTVLVRPSHALFVDQFTNREKPVTDSVEILNRQMRSVIRHSLDAANMSSFKCFERYKSNSDQSRNYLFAAFRRVLLDFPIDVHAESNKRVARKQTLFKDSIYSGVYSSPVKLIGGKMLDTEEVINIDGHQVTTKKLSRFLDDGFRLYERQMATHLQGLAQTERRSLAEVEKFMNGPGVLSYAEHAASMAGYRFWVDLCGPSITEGRCLPGRLISCNEVTGNWETSKAFSFDFGDYVDDSWDEGINCSLYSVDVGASIVANIQKVSKNKQAPCPVDPKKCADLKLAKSKKYLSPVCLEAAERVLNNQPLNKGQQINYTLPAGVDGGNKNAEKWK